MKKIILLIWCTFFLFCKNIQAQQIIFDKQVANSFSLSNAIIYVDAADIALVKKSATFLQQDIEAVTGNKPAIVNTMPSAKNIIIIGSIENSALIKQLALNKK